MENTCSFQTDMILMAIARRTGFVKTCIVGVSIVQKSITETQNKKENCNTEQYYLRQRPLWQRFTYPIVGGILVILGTIGWLLPIVPGFFLVIIGFPLLFCFHPRVELRVRRLLHNIGLYIMKKIRRGRDG